MRCPAKLNLCLHVVGRRSDGYHDLRGVIVPIPWFDELEVETDPSGRGVELVLDPTIEKVPADRRNLAVRAAEVFLGVVGKTVGVRIRLSKDIPVGAGLGGGSSNAAAVLRILNERLGRPLAFSDLYRLAASIGADCPFFLAPRPSQMSGRGDVLVALPGFLSLPLLVVVPRQRLSTSDIFAAFANLGLTRDRGNGKDFCPLGQDQGSRTEPEWVGIGVNDLSEAVFEGCPRTCQWVTALSGAGTRASGVTGTGSAAFGVFDTLDAARSALRALQGSMLPGERAMALMSGMDS